ncbi:PLP-dependent aminotransferase family protein [Kribbella sp. CA-247076]|uniref:MocR-like pyridoxine biosynthesis transcription factor PdxR n=1 Tax=Kribbella sp. CA-247076 TaxID=3239941 RepID=UPI003D8B202A
MPDLHLNVDRTRGVRAGVEHALREAIRTLPAGTRLPSSRALAADLGVARNTVADVYSHLVQEGYLTGDRGGGTRTVATPVSVPAPTATRESFRWAEPSGPIVHDLRPGRPDLSHFPVAAWMAATRHVLDTRPHDALRYDDPRGPVHAREVLADYLARVRGVRAQPDHILLCSGARQAVALVAGAIARAGGVSFGYERPGQFAIPEQLAHAGLQLRPIPVDDLGARVDQLGDAAGVVLTPAHQFPTGVPLAPKRRTAVLAWARAAGAVILEDDYDGEFRYDRQPVGALQGLAPDVVAYAGSASKTLAPGLRLGWLVVPPRLLDAVLEEKAMNDRHCDTLTHLTLAAMIESGAYDRHVRAGRLGYRRRRDELLRALGPRRTRGISAGLQVVLELPGEDEDAVLRRLAERGVVTFGLSHFGADLPPALVLGYGAPSQHAWPGTLAALVEAL